MFKKEILKALKKATAKKEIHLEFPELAAHGDYATNIALQIFSKTPRLQKAKNPRELAEEVVKKLQKDKELAKIVSKIEVAGPGFINFWLSRKRLLTGLGDIIKKKEKYGSSSSLKGKTVLIEHTSPNTIKTLHIGHVRNNVFGMAVARLMEATGVTVKLDAINNDRGIHVMKAVWAYQKYGKGASPKSKKVKPDHFVDRFYIKGTKKGEKPLIKEEMQEMLRRWEAKDKKVRDVWKKLRDWTFEGFLETYKRLGSHHDHQWFESDFYEEGKKIVAEGLKKSIFKKLPDGAVLSNLEKYNLPDTIILRADGTSMYHTQDLRLTQLKRQQFPSDLYIWDIGPEQSLYLKQLFAMCEQLGIGKREDYLHLSYGYVFLKGKGKMSSRQGKVISADWLMDNMVARAEKIIEQSETARGLSKKEKDEVAEAAGIGAIKYGFLRPARESDIHFDIRESLSLEGNSGPYLQYTFARTQSVLGKAKTRDRKYKTGEKNIEELAILRSLPRFPEIIEDAAKNYAPNLLCNYLFDLAQKYNNFYSQHRIIGSDSQDFRLMLTKAVGQVLKNGLRLLGIETPERM